MNSTNIFITGVTGFIGQKLAIAIRRPIKVLSRVKHPIYDSVVCNLGKNPIPDSALEGVDTVFHLAGFSHDFRDADKILNLYRQVNVDATIELARLAVRNSVKKFIFVSSVKAGGSPDFGVCTSEKDQGEPMSG